MFENWQILKTELEEKQEEYSEVAEWCNETGAYTIVENGEVYEVVPVEVPEVVPEIVPEVVPEVVDNEQIIEDSGL